VTLAVVDPSPSRQVRRVVVYARGATLRRRLVNALALLPDVELLGAYSTEDAVVDRARRDEVELVFVDAEIDPLSIGKLCADLPNPPAWFSVSGASPDAGMTTRAILGGAAGVVSSPKDQTPEELAVALRPHVGSAARPVDPSRSPRRARSSPPRPALALPSIGAHPLPLAGRIRKPQLLRRAVLGIGCSTGGPPAVTSLVRGLPATFRVPIAIVQHMAAAHMPYFVDGLRRQLERPVVLAAQGTALEPGYVYVAPGDTHLCVYRDGETLRFKLLDDPPEHNCRPAVDPFFRSLAATCGASAIAAVLTGMGSDGALGGRALHDAGAPVLVQDAETSVVWGMPGATYLSGAASAVLPLEHLASEILQWSL
jgi:two-component system chemotaxis response regulator CheB